MFKMKISDPIALIEALPIGLALCKMDGSLVYVNRAFASMLGYTPDELLALSFWQLMPEEHLSQKKIMLEKIATQGHSGPYETEYIHKDSSLVAVRHNAEVVELRGESFIWSRVERIADDKAIALALRKSEERFRTLFESANDCLLLLDMDGTIADINTVGAYRLGYRKEEMLGHKVAEFDAPDFANRVPERLDLIKQDGEAKFESAHIRRDGTVMPVEISSRILEMNGKSYYFSVIRDISEHKQILDRLHKSEAMYRAVIETSADGFWVTDMEGRFLEVNDAYVRLSGYSREELLTMGIAEIEAREKPEETAAHIEQIRKTGSARFESEHKAKDGSIYPVEIRTTIWPIDKPLLFVFIKDIREQKNAELKLKKLSQAVERGGEAIMITDKNGIIEYVNPAFTTITGYTLAEIYNKKASVLKSSAQDPAFYTELWQTITKGEIWHGALTDRRKDGSFYPALMSIAPIFEDDGEISHYVAVQQDMSEYKKMEHQFHQAQKMEALGTLVGGVAHDFNNMLAGIIGNTYMLKTRCSNNEKSLKNIETIDRLCDKAAGMIRQMLAYAKADYIEPESFLLNEMLRESLRLSEAAIPENIERLIEITADELYVHGDTIQLQQVLINIINNARDAIDDQRDGRISCSLTGFVADDEFLELHPSCKGRHLARLTIADNGCGIPEDQLSKIFDPFFTTKGVDKGNGLGLSMVYGAIQNHQGAIDVISHVGEGASFIIYLPLVAKVEKPPEVVAPTINGSGKELIIIADDEDMVREMYRDILTDLGYRIRLARNGLEAIEVYQENKDDCALVILDVVMPKMGGVDAARVIQQNNSEIPIIFSTGYDKDVALKNTQDLKNFECIGKPFNVDHFIQSIRRLIG